MHIAGPHERRRNGFELLLTSGGFFIDPVVSVIKHIAGFRR